MATRKEILLIEIREDGARVVKRNINDIGGAAENAQSSIGDLKNLLGGLISTKLLKDTVMLADTYANLMNRIRVVTDSNYELQKAMEGVYNMTIDTRTSLEANVDLFARVKLNTDRMGLSMKQVLEFATSLNHAVILSGVTAREAQWGMVQFSQALAAGALRGDELRAVMEQLPVVTKVIAKHMGVTRGELRLLAFQGRVTSKVMIEAFSKTKGAANELADLFAKRIPTIDQGLTALRSAWIRFIGEQDQATQGTANLAKGLMFIAKNMDLLGRLAEIAALVIGGVLMNNAIKLLAQMKLFNFTLIRTHWLLATFAVAVVSVGVFADKIKVSDTGMASLSDTVAAFVPEIMMAAEAMGEFVAAAADSDKIGFDMDTTIQDLGMNLGRFADNFVGVFVGVWAVMKNTFENIVNFQIRLVLTLQARIRQFGSFVSTFLNLVKIQVTATGQAIKAALKGNTELAEDFINQAQTAAASRGNLSMDDFFDEPDLSKFQDSGKSSWEAFKAGFEGSGSQSEDMMARVFAAAQETAGSRGKGTEKDPGDEGGLTPVESVLFKKLTGDLEGLTAKASTLKDLFFKDVYGSILQANIALKDGSMLSEDYKVAMTALTSKALFFADSQGELQMLMDRGLITQHEYAINLAVVNSEMEKLEESTKKSQLTMEMFHRTTVEGNINALKTATDMSSGFKRGFMELGLEITDFASLAEKTVSNAFTGMEDALVSFVTTGKVDFKGLVDSILSDLTRLLMRQMLVKALGSMMPGGAAAGGLGALFAASGKASGGHMMPGGAYRVGDDGPEIVQMGNSAGNVVNARDTANMAVSAQAPAAEQPITIINLWADDDIGAYMEDNNKGGRIIVNKSPGRGKAQR